MYCKQCGEWIPDNISYCHKCGYGGYNPTNQYGHKNVMNTNNYTFENVLLDKLNKSRTAAIIGTVIPIIIHFSVIAMIFLIFFEGILDGDLDNLNNSINDYEAKGFAVLYGILFALTLPLNIFTFVVMLNKAKQLSNLQRALATGFDCEVVYAFGAKFNTKIVIASAVLQTVLLGVLPFGVPQIIICINLVNFKKICQEAKQAAKNE